MKSPERKPTTQEVPEIKKSIENRHYMKHRSDFTFKNNWTHNPQSNEFTVLPANPPCSNIIRNGHGKHKAQPHINEN